MNDKVKAFLDAKKDAEMKKLEESKNKTLIELGLYEKEYAPMVGHGHVEGNSKDLKFMIKNKRAKIGDIITVSKNGERIDVIIDSIQSEYNSEFPEAEWDSDNLTNKYYKKVPVEITEEEYEEVKKYSKDSVKVVTDNSIAATLKVIAVFVYIVGFIAGVVIGGALTDYTRDFSWGTAFACWFLSLFSGTTVLGFAEIIQLLTDIKNK
ncbi:MAG: hypothetical protein IJN96_00935 [Clostridia bacterium]|nr:hypothetical protein [Clostridia bacterium]